MRLHARHRTREERLAAALLLSGSVLVFTPILVAFQRWRDLVVRQPDRVWGGRWLVDHVRTDPAWTLALLLLTVALGAAIGVAVLYVIARRLAAKIAQP